MSKKPRLRIGDVYFVAGLVDDVWLNYAFEICGEAWIHDERWAIAVNRNPPSDPERIVIMFDSLGRGTLVDMPFHTKRLSARSPRLQRPAP